MSAWDRIRGLATFDPGAGLGPFEVIGPLGAGGMGEVYRARDARLGREVALKVLPEEYAADAERLRRFEQEARAASALNHPNIVSIHEVGTEGSVPYIVMELVEGKTVRQLLAAGPLPVRKLLGVATQVADGLAKAHAAGIVHRDLKPENLMVSSDGFVKILDFGLAKLAAEGVDGMSRAPTLAQPRTDPGTVLGTVSYMSPEQAEGLALDFHSDQFSFGSILYEMATGKRAFERATRVDTLAAIAREEPPPLDPGSGVPPPLRWIVERCLAKDPTERYAATLDLARELACLRDHVTELSGAGAALAPGARPRRRRLVWAAVALALLGGLAVGLLLGSLGSGPRQPVTRLDLAVSPEQSPVQAESPTLALSPDGSLVVFAGRAPGGRQRLYARPLDRFEVTPIPGTEGAVNPFFSPDGQWVGFGADKKLIKVALAGGRPLTLCDAETLRGASWGPDGQILFSPVGTESLWRVPETGGEPRRLTTLDPEQGEGTHRWPQILPGGEAALFTVNDLTGSYDGARIEAVRLDDGKRWTVLEGATHARYLSSGHLVFLRAGSLFAVRFDLDRLAVTGTPVPVLDGLSTYSVAGFANYDLSPSGTLVYIPLDPGQFERELVWVDRSGATHPVTDLRRHYSEARVSPDGRRLALSTGGPETEIWIYDLERDAWDRLVRGSLNWSPVWSHDGQRLAYCSNRDGGFHPFWMPIDRSAAPERLTVSGGWSCPSSWLPDGRTLLIVADQAGTGFDVLSLTLDAELTVRPVLQTAAAETNARLSYDGRWMAYQSNDSGRLEVYVLPYPGPGARWQVSTEGGSDPIWSRDGREIFFASGGWLMAARVEEGRQFRTGPPERLLELANPESSYDVAPDGRRFIMTRWPALAQRHLAVVLGWPEEVKRRLQAVR